MECGILPNGLTANEKMEYKELIKNYLQEDEQIFSYQDKDYLVKLSGVKLS